MTPTMSHSRASDLTVVAILALLAVLFVSDGAQAQTPRGRPRHAPHFWGLPALQLEGGAYTGTGIPGAQGGDPGTFSSGGNRSQLVVPYTWGVRLGYSGSGAVGSGPGTDNEWAGAAVAFDWTALDTPLLTLRARATVAVGEAGLQYFAIDAPLVRIRVPLESTDALWLAFAPLDIEARATSSALTRSRFGWMPAVGIDGIFRVGGTERVPCHERPAGSPPTDICNPRYAGLADGACVIRVGLRAGASIGYQQTQGNDVAHFLTGAEARMSCETIVVDLSSLLLVSGEGAHASRTTADIFTRFAVGSFDIGPYATSQISYEMADTQQPATAPERFDRTFFQFDAGLRIMWDADRGIVVP